MSRRQTASITATLAAVLLFVVAPSYARLVPEVIEAQPAAKTADPAPQAVPTPPPVAQPMATASPGCCTPQPVCCRTPCITYRHCGPRLCCDCTQSPTETVLKVKNPCTGCESDVQVCLPGCCTGEPNICFGTGFLGRNIVEYEWCCGYTVRVAFKHTGDLLVTTWGR